MMNSRRARAGAIALLLAGPAAGAMAQTSGGTVPQTIPGLDGFSLPSTQPTPAQTPTPASTPAAIPEATSVPAPVVEARPRPERTPAPRVTPTPRATPAPLATPTPRVTAVPASAVTPAASPAPAPTVAPTADADPVPQVAAPASQDDRTGWIVGAVLLLAAAVAGLWWYRRTASAPDRGVSDGVPAAVPVAVPPAADVPLPPVTPAPAPAAPATDRAMLSLMLQPRRAGLNLLSATVEGELLVRNDGTAAATGIRIGAALTGASAGPQSDVAALFAQPVVRPVTPPFALAPGEERRVRIVAALPRADIRPLEAGGRGMFVPVVAVNAVYATDGGDGQAAQAFAIGVERVDSAKLAPLWLDQPPRMFDALGARPYAVAIVR